MNYLALCNMAKRECGLLGTQMTDVTGQTGDNDRIVEWVKQAWGEIQGRHINWRWMRRTATVQTAADDDDYAPGEWTDTTDSALISRFSHWLFDDYDDLAKCYLTSSGVGTEYWLPYVPWNSFKGIYKKGSQTSSSPSHISIDPNNNAVVGAAPSGIYTLTADYQMSEQTLAANADTPDMPSKFHMLIVWKVLEQYGFEEESQSRLTRGKTNGDRLMRQLEGNQLPDVTLAGSLA